MDLFHVFDTVVNSNTGVPMSGVQVRLKFDGTEIIAPIYASQSGDLFDPPNTCLTDVSGMYSFYVEASEYTLDFLVGGVLIRTIMNFRPAEFGLAGPANSTYALTADLEASNVANVSAILAEAGKAGTFTIRDYADFTSQVAADTGKLNYIRSGTDTSKVWVRTSILSQGASLTGTSAGNTVEAEVAAKATALGIARTATDLGAFTGTLLSSGQTAKQALQVLATETEVRPTRPELNLPDTASTSAIQAIVDSTSDNGGRVELLRSDYALAATLTSGAKAVEYQGAGPEATRMTVDGPRSAIEHGLTAQVYYASLAVRNLTISATNAAIGNSQTAIKAEFDKNSGGFLLENVVFRPFADGFDFAQYVHATGATRTTMRNVRALGSTFDSDSATDVQIAFRFTSNDNADKSYEYVFDDMTVYAEQSGFLFEVLGAPGNSGSLEGVTMTNVRGRSNYGPFIDFKVVNGGWKPPFFTISNGFNYQGTGAIAHFDGIESLTIENGWHAFDAAITGSPTLNQIQLRNARKVVIRNQTFRIFDLAKLQWIISIEAGCSDVLIEDCIFIYEGAPTVTGGGIFVDATCPNITIGENNRFIDWPANVPKILDSTGKNLFDWINTADRIRAEVFARDYGAVGDGTLRTVADWYNPALPTRIKYRSLADLQIDYPHVTAGTDSMDWAAIQKAVNTGKNVGFHDGRYMIGANTIVSTTVAQGFYGLNASSGANLGDPATRGAIIMPTPTGAGSVAWRAEGSHSRFVNMKFWGSNSYTDDTAVQGKKATNTDDMDISFIDCEFYQFNKSIYSYGRGLLVDRCLFSQADAGFAITNDWPASGIGGTDEAQTDDRYKGRALRVTNNRLHGTGTLVRILNFVARSPIIADNMLDLGNQLLLVESGGGVLYANIDGNVADACGQTPIQFKVGTSCVGLSVTGGSLGGSIAATIDGAAKRPFNIIEFDSCTEIDGVSISNVELHASAAYVVSLANTGGGAAITAKNISIKGGRISSFGQTGPTARSIINSAYDITGLTIDPGSIADVGPSATALIRTVGPKTVTDLHIGPACSRVALPTLLTTTLAGNVDGIERLSAGRFKRYLGRWNLWEQEVTATPEASLIGYKGCRAINLTTGDTYTFKGTDGTNTGWVAL